MQTKMSMLDLVLNVTFTYITGFVVLFVNFMWDGSTGCHMLYTGAV